MKDPGGALMRELKQTKPFSSPQHEASVSVLKTADCVRRVVAHAMEGQEITHQQYNVLRILRGAGENGLPTLEIAVRMIEQAPGITRLLDRLEARELVSRRRCTTDRRQVFCTITPSGLDLLAKLDAPVNAAAGESMQGLSPEELQNLLKLLEKVREALR